MSNILMYWSISIEVTRRCNMVCSHCMRGRSQARDMNLDLLDTFLRGIKNSYVHTIFFTGGEPSLVPEIIDFTLSKILEYNIHIEECGVVTNGKDFSDYFIEVSNKWGTILNFFCEVSIDSYHPKLSEEDYDKIGKINNVASRLFNSNSDHILNGGYAKKNGIGTIEMVSPVLMSTRYKNHPLVLNTLVLTCDGDVLDSCSYEYTDTDRFKICNYNDDLEFFVRSKGVYVDIEHCGVATYIYRWFDHIRKNGGNI